jgi:hypothetical protein
MCTLMIGNTPRLVAWTDGASTPATKKRRQRSKAKKDTAVAAPLPPTPAPKAQVAEKKEERFSPQFGGEREPIGFDNRSDDYEGGTRYKCSKFNRGRKAHDHIEHIRRSKFDVKRSII